MVGQLTYRPYDDQDLPHLVRLWREETDWYPATPELWRQWYLDTPYGRSLVVVAADENDQIVGQVIFKPSLVLIDNRQVRALRMSAPILHKDLRRVSLRDIGHPVIGLSKMALEMAVAEGYGLVYALPDQSWLPFFQWAPRVGLPRFAVAAYPCVARPIDVPLPESLDDVGHLVVRPATDFGEEYNQLWQSAREVFPITCSVVRSPEWVRYESNDCLPFEARQVRDGALVGYTVIQKYGRLVDILARSPAELTHVLAATVKWLAAQPAGTVKDHQNRLKVLDMPAIRPTLQTLGFKPMDYTFAFVCHSLDSSLPAGDALLERWYIMPGD